MLTVTGSRHLIGPTQARLRALTLLMQVCSRPGKDGCTATDTEAQRKVSRLPWRVGMRTSGPSTPTPGERSDEHRAALAGQAEHPAAALDDLPDQRQPESPPRAYESRLGCSSQWLARFHALTFTAQCHNGSHQVQ
jgi:hypothetical protein